MRLDRYDLQSTRPRYTRSTHKRSSRVGLLGIGLALLVIWVPGSAADPPGVSETQEDVSSEAMATSEAGTEARLVTCSERDGKFRPTRIADRISLGLGVSFQECIDAIQASSEGVVCGRHDRNEFHIVKIGTPETGFFSLGREVTQEQCLQMTAAAHDGLVCTRERRGFRQTEIETGVSLGGDITFEQCLLL